MMLTEHPAGNSYAMAMLFTRTLILMSDVKQYLMVRKENF